MMTLLKKIKLDESGASAAEYALIVAIIGAVVVAGAAVLGGGIGAAFATADGQLRGAGTAP